MYLGTPLFWWWAQCWVCFHMVQLHTSTAALNIRDDTLDRDTLQFWSTVSIRFYNFFSSPPIALRFIWVSLKKTYLFFKWCSYGLRLKKVQREFRTGHLRTGQLMTVGDSLNDTCLCSLVPDLIVNRFWDQAFVSLSSLQSLLQESVTSIGLNRGLCFSSVLIFSQLTQCSFVHNHVCLFVNLHVLFDSFFLMYLFSYLDLDICPHQNINNSTNMINISL